MAKQVMDVRAGAGMTVSQSNEHLRVASDGAYESRLSNNFDPTRERLNFEIQNGEVTPVDKSTSIPKSIETILWKRGINDPNKELIKKGKEPNRRTVANFILGGSREQMHRLAFGDQEVNLEHGADNSAIKRMPEIENWAKDMYQFMSEKFGEKNIARFVVHLDETNPHVHCTVLPITKDEKFSWKKVMVGNVDSKFEYQKRMIKLHDEVAAINARYGLDRGDSIAETGAKHRTTEQYHQALRKELREENKQLRQEMEDNERTIQEQRSTMSSLDKEIKHASARCKALNTMIANLERRKDDLEREIKALIKDRDSGKISAEEAAKKMDKITKELNKVKSDILDKEAKLQVAEEKLSALADKTQEQEDKYKEVEEKLKAAKAGLDQHTVQEMQAFGYNLMAAELMSRKPLFNSFKGSLSQEGQEQMEKATSILFGQTLLEKSATDIVAVSHIATALFLGYLDKATAIAEGHGGGGGPGSGWGRKDDEDDNAFRRRCFGMAMMMMMPSRERKVKR